MQVKIIAKCFTGSGKNMFPGEQVDLADSTAARLIRAGFAEEVKLRAKPKKSNRAIFSASSPEDDG
jgi:hypothetical protein